MAGSRQAGLDIEAVGRSVIRDKAKTQEPNQSRMFNQVAAQVRHVAFVFVQLNNERSDVSCTRMRHRAGPGIGGVTFGKVVPIQRAEQVQILHRYRTVANEGG